MLARDADLTDQYVSANQPGRVIVHRISWLHGNRGGQGIMQLHAQDIVVVATVAPQVMGVHRLSKPHVGASIESALVKFAALCPDNMQATNSG